MTPAARLRYTRSYLIGAAVMLYLAATAPRRIGPHPWRVIHHTARAHATRGLTR